MKRYMVFGEWLTERCNGTMRTRGTVWYHPYSRTIVPYHPYRCSGPSVPLYCTTRTLVLYHTLSLDKLLYFV